MSENQGGFSHPYSQENSETLGNNPTIQHFTRLAAEAIQEILGGRLVAIYLHGSAATGDFVPNRSDLDLIVVVETSLSTSEKEKLLSWFTKHTPPSNLAGIDCELLTRQEAGTPSRLPHWDTIIRIQRHQHHFDVSIQDSPDGYSLLDLAEARDRGCVLIGPPPMTVLAAYPRLWLLQACTTQLQRRLSWDSINDRSGAVLTACRSWLYLSSGVHGTKSEAGAWARPQSPRYASIIDAARAQRRGDTEQILDNQEVKAFCKVVLSYLEDAIRASDIEEHT